jgi:hypothetical protein
MLKTNTPQQLEFVRNYLSPTSETYGNAYASAKAAGYSESYSKSITDQAPWLSELLGKTQLVSPDEVISGIKAETSTEKAADRLKAWELLGKHLKLFTDKVDLGGEVAVTFKVTRGENNE